jgi:DtxR family transcriptional regulator, Mn-dependent transcriptional regulator
MSSSFPDPVAALLIFAALVPLTAVLVWPGVGITAQLRRVGALSERVRLEDGLKHLFTFAVAHRPSSVESLAGAIGVSRKRVVEIVRRLERMDLARLKGEDIVLTHEGRVYAFRVVRTHRLWERYLADRTGVSAAEWHARAERLEHRLSPEQVEGLAASMSHLVYDPHGDPIPTADGVLPSARGVPLSSLSPETSAQVVHIEDEPEDVYRSLRVAGINVGSRLWLERIEPTAVHLTVDGRPIAIEPVAAWNPTVERVEDDGSDEGLERLDALHPGEEGVVVRLAGAVQGPQRRRLLDLGVVPGTVIRAELTSASGCPVAYRIRGAVIALRRAQADDILMRRRSSQETT